MRACRKLSILFLFGIAMAFMEAAVVIYLRGLYYPDGFSFPLRVIPQNILAVELGREFSTIVMLGVIGTIAGKNLIERFSYFIFCFGVWDIFYYFFLKQILNWPPSLLTWDILFLIPVPWVGPVLAPMLVALTMVIITVISVLKIEKGCMPKLLKLDWVLGFMAAIIIFISFIWNFPGMIRQELPSPYHWELLIIGEAIGLFSFYRMSKRTHTEKKIEELTKEIWKKEYLQSGR